jgi:hypothetical protein
VRSKWKGLSESGQVLSGPADMSTKSREVIWGSRISGAKIRAEGAREEAIKAVRRSCRGRSLVGAHGRLRRPGTTGADDRAMS